MNLKFSHNLSIDQDGKVFLTPSALSKALAFAPLAIGFLFLLSGGIKAIIGLGLLIFGTILLFNLKIVTCTNFDVTITPYYDKLINKFIAKNTQHFALSDYSIEKDDVKGDFRFSFSDFRFFPLNACRVTLKENKDPKNEVCIAYLSLPDTEKITNLKN